MGEGKYRKLQLSSDDMGQSMESYDGGVDDAG